MKIAYATCAELPEPDLDEALVLAALRAAGHEIELLVWDEPYEGGGTRAAEFDLCLIRATWNYPLAVDAFRAWIARVDAQTVLWNPAEAVRWNLDKRYLLELESKGVPIIPTVRLERGDSGRVADIARENLGGSWGSVVIKPSISAGSWETLCFGPDRFGAADAFLAESLAQRDTLVQRYMSEVERGGERALVWIDGELTHAIEKQPRFGDDDEEVTLGPTPTERERAFASDLLSLVGGELLFARVDVIAGDDGELLLSELELIEPSLFFPHSAAALGRFVSAVGRLNASTGSRRSRS